MGEWPDCISLVYILLSGGKWFVWWEEIASDTDAVQRLPCARHLQVGNQDALWTKC